MSLETVIPQTIHHYAFNVLAYGGIFTKIQERLWVLRDGTIFDRNISDSPVKKLMEICLTPEDAFNYIVNGTTLKIWTEEVSTEDQNNVELIVNISKISPHEHDVAWLSFPLLSRSRTIVDREARILYHHVVGNGWIVMAVDQSVQSIEELTKLIAGRIKTQDDHVDIDQIGLAEVAIALHHGSTVPQGQKALSPYFRFEADVFKECPAETIRKIVHDISFSKSQLLSSAAASFLFTQRACTDPD